MNKSSLVTAAAMAVAALAGCIHTSHKIEPIHITLDVNLKIDNDLDKFFASRETSPEAAKANERAAMRERFRAREPLITELKAKGAVGEAQNGFLATVNGELDADAKKLMNEENADRGKLFAAIAAKQGTTSDLVAKRRVSRNAERAKPGDYIMDADGKWTRK